MGHTSVSDLAKKSPGRSGSALQNHAKTCTKLILEGELGVTAWKMSADYRGNTSNGIVTVRYCCIGGGEFPIIRGTQAESEVALGKNVEIKRTYDLC